ncbi:hypothetical protein BDR22DRAFT_853087 [Usnea florida]
MYLKSTTTLSFFPSFTTFLFLLPTVPKMCHLTIILFILDNVTSLSLQLLLKSLVDHGSGLPNPTNTLVLTDSYSSTEAVSSSLLLFKNCASAQGI